MALSDGRRLVVGLSVLAETGITRVGMAVGEAALARLLEEHTLTDLVDRALGYLARGRRTRRELEQRLRRLEVTSGQITLALDRLEASGALSDEEVAAAEAASRLRRGEAPARVGLRLRRKGLAGRLVSEAIQGALADEGFDERAACLDAARKRARQLAHEEPAAARRKLFGFLRRRGYGGAVAHDAVRTVLRGSVDEGGAGADGAEG